MNEILEISRIQYLEHVIFPSIIVSTIPFHRIVERTVPYRSSPFTQIHAQISAKWTRYICNKRGYHTTDKRAGAHTNARNMRERRMRTSE